MWFLLKPNYLYLVVYILGTFCETFDKTSNRFVTLKSLNFIDSYGMKAILVGDKILLLKDETKLVICYDFEKDEWSRDSCKATVDTCCYSLVKVPVY